MAAKDVGVRIRVERTLRDAFLEACRAEDRPAAQVIRTFMKQYIARANKHAEERSSSADKE